MPPAPPRRTRANPSPSGLKELPAVQKTRRVVRKAKNAEEASFGDDTGDSDQHASFSERRDQSPTPAARGRAGKSRSSSAELQASKQQSASDQTRRYNTRSHTRSISPETEENVRAVPAPQPKQTRANTRSKKRARAEEPVVEEEDGYNADEQRPAKRSRQGRPKKAAASKKVQPVEENKELSTPIPSIETPQRRKTSESIGLAEEEDDTHSRPQTPRTPQTLVNPEEPIEIDDNASAEPTPSIQTAHFRQTFGNQKSFDGEAMKDVPREQDLANHKTPKRKNTIANPRTEPRRGDMLKLSERMDTDILLHPGQKLLYEAWLKEEYCLQYNRTKESFNKMSLKTQASMLKLMRKKVFKPSRTFPQYLQATGNGTVAGRASSQEVSNDHIDHDETEEEDSIEFSVLPTADSPELPLYTPHKPGWKEQRDLETTRVQGSRPSMSQSHSIPRETISPARFANYLSKEALLTDRDVLEAAKVVSQVFAADQSRRGKPFPNAERLGQFLDQFQQEEVASSRKVTTPRKTQATRNQLESSKGSARSALSSPINDHNSDDEMSDTDQSLSPATDSNHESTIQTPKSQTSPEAEKSRGWLSSFTSSLTSPLKKFGLGGRSQAATPAPNNPAESGIFTQGGLSPEDLSTPTRKPASHKFGADRKAGIKAAVGRRKERTQNAQQGENLQTPIHLRGVMTSEARAALHQQEGDVHGEARRKKREAAQQEDSQWTEEYIDERGYDMVATWVMDGGKRKRMVSQRLKNPSYQFPESSDDDSTDAEESVSGSPQTDVGAPSNIAPNERSEPPRKRIFQQARRAIGLDTPPSAEELEELSRNQRLDESFGDPYRARPYTGKYLKNATSVERNVHEGRHPLYNGSEAVQSTGNVFEEQTREGSSGFDAMFPGFRPPSSGSSSGESASESDEHVNVNPNVEAFGQYLKQHEEKKKAEQRQQLGLSDDQSALQEKQWTQSPPPKPKPSNATLPGKQISDEEAAKAREARIQAEKYLPKKPSRLREVEQASPIHQKENALPQFFNMAEETMIEMGVDGDIMSAIMSIDDGVIIDLDLPTERFSRSRSNSIDKAVDMLFT